MQVVLKMCQIVSWYCRNQSFFRKLNIYVAGSKPALILTNPRTTSFHSTALLLALRGPSHHAPGTSSCCSGGPAPGTPGPSSSCSTDQLLALHGPPHHTPGTTSCVYFQFSLCWWQSFLIGSFGVRLFGLCFHYKITSKPDTKSLIQDH